MSEILNILSPNKAEIDMKLNSDDNSEEVVKKIVEEAGQTQTDDGDKLKQNPNLEAAEANGEVEIFLPSNKWYRNKKFIFILKHVAAMIYLCTMFYIMYYILDMAFGPKSWREKKNKKSLTLNS